MYKYKGSGSYGCVISPSLPCLNKNESVDNSNTKSNNKQTKIVSKLFFENDKYIEEIKLMNKVRQLKKTFGVVKLVKNHCRAIPDQSVINLCNHNSNETFQSSSIYQIIYEDGGKSIDDFETFTYNQAYSIIMNMENVFKFLEYLNVKNGLYHVDIASRNILYNEKTNEVFLIDFGKLNEGNENASIQKDAPPEFKIKQKYIERRHLKWNNKHEMRSILFPNEDTYNSKLQEVQNAAYNLSYHELFYKLDSFMLGVVISEICERSILLIYNPVFGNKPDDLIKPFVEFVQILLINVLEFNPKKRWSYPEILKHYKQFKASEKKRLKNLSRAFSKKELSFVMDKIEQDGQKIKENL